MNARIGYGRTKYIERYHTSTVGRHQTHVNVVNWNLIVFTPGFKVIQEESLIIFAYNGIVRSSFLYAYAVLESIDKYSPGRQLTP